jgi:hypothetical protein
MSVESFTTPRSVLKRDWRASWLALATVAALLYFVDTDLSLLAIAGCIAITGGVLYLIHSLNARLVWVTLSEDGMRQDWIFQHVAVTWQEPVVIEERQEYDLDGIVVRRSSGGGKSKREGDWFFIPTSVLQTESFRAAVARLAPPLHPLRQKVGSAI